MNTCPFDPVPYKGQPIGMFHCPECGEMVLAGVPHPDYSEEMWKSLEEYEKAEKAKDAEQDVQPAEGSGR